MSKKYFNYEPYIKSLINFMDKHIKLKPYPTIKLSKKNHGEDNVLAPTGFYTPDSKTITIYTRKRAVKDCMRSIAHELIHHYQNLDGRLNDGAYNGQEIINDDKLMKLEEEAYLKGNILFRSWTEHLKQENEEKIEDKPTEHMRKLIKLDENQLKQIIENI
jgi:hypothetical protein